MGEDAMICYTFEFFDDYKAEVVKKDIWAWHEAEAWKKADDYAFANGYADYRLEED